MATRNATVTLCVGASCACTIAMPVFAATETVAAGAGVQQLALVVPQVGPSATHLTDDLELRRRRAVIGRIDIQVDDVFETQHALAAPYRLANTLHISTKRQTIADQLLFHAGEIYDRHALDETARLLRDQRYLNEAKDPNLFGTWWRLSAAHADLSDGIEDALAITRPFYSLDSRWSLSVAGSDATTTQSRYALGHIVDQFGMQRQLFDVGGGVSRGLIDGWTTRYLGGVRYESRDFSALPYPIHRDAGAAAIGADASTLIPEDRVLAYPWLGIEVIEDEYRTTRNLDQIGRTEDLYLGRSARFEAGYASTAFGSTQNAVMLDGSLHAGLGFTEDQFLINTVGFTGRVERGALRNTVLDLGSRYYLRQSLRNVLFVSAALSFSSELDPEEQLLLGGDNGLRGYPLRYQAGTSRALFTLEERFYTNWQPLKLFNVGAAVFFDAGRTWGTDPHIPHINEGAGGSMGWLKDVGVGLRLGSARSGLGNVLHIDLACPLDGGDDIDSVQLLIETRRSF